MISDSQEAPDASQEQALAEPIEDSTEKVLSFKKYIEENPDFKLSEESLTQFYNDLDAIIEEYDVIEFSIDPFVQKYINSCKRECK